MYECVVRLAQHSGHGSSRLGSNSLRILDDTNGKRFEMKGDFGRNVYTQVRGYLKQNAGLTYVTGFGRIPFGVFPFMMFFFFMSCFLAYANSDSPPLVIYCFFIGIGSIIFLVLTIRNRNDLIKTVYQVLSDKALD